MKQGVLVILGAAVMALSGCAGGSSSALPATSGGLSTMSSSSQSTGGAGQQDGLSRLIPVCKKGQHSTTQNPCK